MVLHTSKCQNIAMAVWLFFVACFCLFLYLFLVVCFVLFSLFTSLISNFILQGSHGVKTFSFNHSNSVKTEQYSFFFCFLLHSHKLCSLGACRYKSVATELLTFAHSKFLLILSKGRNL